MSGSTSEQIENINQAITALEAQRAILGEQVVETALAGLHQQLAALQAAPSTPPPQVEQRRIVTVLFSDIVGSTAIADQMDAEDYRDLAAKIHAMAGRAVEKNDGVVLQYLGDGLLAVFGMRSPGEQDPINAVKTGLEIQSGLRRLELAVAVQMRVGIHSGMVMLSEIGSEESRAFTAMGDTMNLASRLQSAAPPGGVLISHETFRYVRGIFEAEPQPLITVKGKRDALQTYLVRRMLPRSFHTTTRGVAGIRTTTVGREVEFASLKKAYQEAVQQGCVVWAQLIGEAGIGKSRLMDDLFVYATGEPGDLGLFKARAFPGDENQAYGLIRHMWFDRFQVAEDLPIEEAQQRWERGFLEMGGHDLRAAAHALGLLCGLPFSDSPYIGAIRHDPEQVKGRAIVVSRELLQSFSRRMHMLILLEDLHWADPASWDYLVQVGLATSCGQHGILILASARPEWKPPQALLEFPNYQPVRLENLPDAAILELANQLTSEVSGIPQSVLERIVGQAEGVPYFAEEMVNWFIDRGIIDTSRQPWRFAPEKLDETGLPTTLQHLLLTRLSALGDENRYNLQCGSIFGRSFWEGGLAALGSSNPSGVAELQPRGFVDAQIESSLAGEREWSFHHNLLRDVTYDSVLKRQRPELHRAAAAWLEEQARRAERLDEFAGLLAEHYEKAGNSLAAANWLLSAGRFAKQRGASQSARRFFDRALTLAPFDDLWLRWEILLGRSEVLGILGESGQRDADITSLLSLAQDLGDLDCMAEAENRRAWMLSTTGDEGGAVQAYERAASIARQAGNPKIEAAALSTKTVSLTRLGEISAAEGAANQALSIGASVGVDDLLARVLVNVSVYYSAIGDLAGAVQSLEQAVEIYHRIGDLGGEAAGQTNLGYCYMQLGEYGRGLTAMQLALQQSLAFGGRLVAGYSRLNQGLIQVRLGDAQAAFDILAEAGQDLTKFGDQFGLAAKLSYEGLAHENAGHIQQAVENFTQAWENFNALGSQVYALDAAAGLARSELSAGNLERAGDFAYIVWQHISEHGIQGLELPIWDCLSCYQVFQAAGDERAAREALVGGYQHLMERAAAISDRAWRESYLENVPEHQAIIGLYHQSFPTKGEPFV